jgi:O-antigen/teichoic acid export membrane protein
MSNLIKSTSIYTIVGFLPLAFGFFISPVYTFFLTTEDNGIINLFTLICGIFLNFFVFGIDGVFAVKHFEVIKNKAEEKRLIRNSFTSILLIGSLNSVLLTILSYLLLPLILNPKTNFPFYPNIIFIIIFSFSQIIWNFYLSYLRNKEKIRKFALFSISLFSLTVILSLLLVVYFKLGNFGALFSRTLSIFILVIFILIDMRNFICFKINYKMLKAHLILGVPICIYLILGQFNYSLDRILIEKYFTLNELGIYGLALLIASTSEIWITAISNATSPTIYKLLNADLKEGTSKLREIFRMQIISVIFLVCVIISLSPMFYKLAIHRDYHIGLMLIPALAFGFIGRALYVIYVPFIFVKNKTKYLPIINGITLVISFVISIIFLPYFGFSGILISFTCTKFIQLPIVYYFSQKCEKFDFQLKIEYLLILFILLTILSIYWTKQLPPAYSFQIPLIFFILFSFFSYRKKIVILAKNLRKRDD